MKYVVDIDALISCIDFLEAPARYNGYECIRRSDIKDFIEEFPKDDLADYVEHLVFGMKEV